MMNASSWTDKNGNFWLFGGFGYDGNDEEGYLGDLWEFNPSTKQWSWVIGFVYADPHNSPANVPMPLNRTGSATWTDNQGNLWLFGGYDFLWPYGSSYTSDLWEYSGGWTLVGGNTGAAYFGVYGTLGKPDSGNIPGSRSSASSWTDKSGHLWLFGGWGLGADDGSQPGTFTGDLNDLWEFDPSSKEWAWWGGSSKISPHPGVYGSLGEPAAGNAPGIRQEAANWTDSNGNFWLFGGWGTDSTQQACGPDDIWEFNPTATQWAWMGGSDVCDAQDQTGVYGIQGTPAPGNLPPGRIQASTWKDMRGNLWLFGGTGYNGAHSTFENGPYLNDLWVYQPLPGDFSFTVSASSISITGGQSGTATITVKPIEGFDQAISFACSGLPSGATCSFSPLTVTPPGTTSTTLTVTTSSGNASLHRNAGPLYPASALAAALFCFGLRRRRRLLLFLILAMSLTGFGLLAGCGGGSNSGGGSQPVTVTVTATAPSASHTATFSLTIN
ncbi:MAG: kelch repeat-containing protein [Terracidiphilus sp.]